ncbi:MAG: YHS domain protein [Legionellales bacterium]|nr:YHS domain protein [Legionellales bacterium]
MTQRQHYFLATLLALWLLPLTALATDSSVTHSLPGAQGYDLVSYFTNGEPQKGNGNHTFVYENVIYLFINQDHKEKFKANPQQYLPIYGGYCAFAITMGKKVVGDPLAWQIVDDKLYLNLNKKVQKRWQQAIPENIAKANEQWPEIKDIPVNQL